MSALFAFPGSAVTPPIPTTEPDSFAAGETVQWQRTFAGYAPSDGWTVRYYFVGPDVFQFTADSSSGNYVITAKAKDTAEKPAGLYRWRAYAEQGADATLERRFLDSGTCTLIPNFATADDDELSDDPGLVLAKIDAVLTGRITADVESYAIAGRSIMRIPIAELMKLRGIYAALAWQARNPGVSSPQHGIRFTGNSTQDLPVWQGTT